MNLETALIEKAQEVAIIAHGEQKYGDKPYFYHLCHVDQVACRFGYYQDKQLRACCFLHDVVEDTHLNIHDLRRDFGPKIAEIVDAVSDRTGESKADVFEDRTRHCADAVLLKTFDRIANVEACIAERKPEVLEKYVKEHPLFEKILKVGEIDYKLELYLNEIMSVAGWLIEDKKEEE